ncbi:hypothetical protein GQ43DRAFT_335127, partial [Delitschia confertaspora ATCC 74209]
LQSIHLFRALLREATYLPDSTARQYFRSHIVARFKAYQPAKDSAGRKKERIVENYKRQGYKRRATPVIIERTPEKLRTGRKALSLLRRANTGETKCLEKVLLAAYGRLGRRKYALLADLFKPEPLPNEENVESGPGLSPLQEAYYSNKRVLSFFGAPTVKSKDETEIQIFDKYPRLKELIKSQKQSRAALSSPLRSTSVTFPSRNVWERPMPIKRARNNVRKWFKDTMTRVLPPLPEEEWDRLKGLSRGTIQCEGIVPHRARGTVLTTEACLTKSPLDYTHQAGEKILQASIKVKKPSFAEMPRGRHRPHSTITRRSMRRLYAVIFSRCCKMEWDSERSKWVARWGSAKPQPLDRVIPVEETFFAGVDKRGKLLK